MSPGSSEGEGGDAAMGGATKKKKSKKKKKSGDREHPPPPQEKKLDTPILLDFSQVCRFYIHTIVVVFHTGCLDSMSPSLYSIPSAVHDTGPHTSSTAQEGGQYQ